MNLYVNEDNLSLADQERLHTVMIEQYAPLLDSIEAVEDYGRFDLGNVTISFDAKERIESGDIYLDEEAVEIDFRGVDRQGRIAYRTYEVADGFLIVIDKESIPFVGLRIMYALVDIITCDSVNHNPDGDIGWIAMNSLIITYTTGILESNPTALLSSTFVDQGIVSSLVGFARQLDECKDKADREVLKQHYFTYLVKLCTYVQLFAEAGMSMLITHTDPTSEKYVNELANEVIIMGPYIKQWVIDWCEGDSASRADINSMKLMYSSIMQRIDKDVTK